MIIMAEDSVLYH